MVDDGGSAGMLSMCCTASAIPDTWAPSQTLLLADLALG